MRNAIEAGEEIQDLILLKKKEASRDSIFCRCFNASRKILKGNARS